MRKPMDSDTERSQVRSEAQGLFQSTKKLDKVPSVPLMRGDGVAILAPFLPSTVTLNTVAAANDPIASFA